MFERSEKRSYLGILLLFGKLKKLLDIALYTASWGRYLSTFNGRICLILSRGHFQVQKGFINFLCELWDGTYGQIRVIKGIDDKI